LPCNPLLFGKALYFFPAKMAFSKHSSRLLPAHVRRGRTTSKNPCAQETQEAPAVVRIGGLEGLKNFRLSPDRNSGSQFLFTRRALLNDTRADRFRRTSWRNNYQTASAMRRFLPGDAIATSIPNTISPLTIYSRFCKTVRVPVREADTKTKINARAKEALPVLFFENFTNLSGRIENADYLLRACEKTAVFPAKNLTRQSHFWNQHPDF
jgi:hypothetical protein